MLIRLSVALWFILLLGCGYVGQETRREFLAPTAVVLKEGISYYGVLDGREELAQWVCLRAESGGSISIVLELDDPVVDGTMAVVDGEGGVLESRKLAPNRSVYEIFETIGNVRNSRCVVMQAASGVSVYSLRWRSR